MLTCNVIITLVPKIIIESVQLMLLNDSITATISYKVKIFDIFYIFTVST